MSIHKIISPDAIIPLMRATSEKSVSLALAKKASDISGLDTAEIANAIFDQNLSAKQRVSMGVAIFHIAFPRLKSSHAIFARLEKCVDFTSVDGEPVDLVFLLITVQSGNNRHLQTLAEASRLFRDRALCKKLRGSTTADAMYALFTDRPD
jgi:PTS system nitrogen regulatory IIA component